MLPFFKSPFLPAPPGEPAHYNLSCPTFKNVTCHIHHVSLTRRELKDYFMPALSRKSFRFGRLHGLVHDGTLQNLRVAKAFGKPGPSSFRGAYAKPDKEQTAKAYGRPDKSEIANAYLRRRNQGKELIRELVRAGPELQHPAMDVFRELSKSAGPGGRIPIGAHADAMEQVQKILRECGVHAVFGQPTSAGLMLHEADAAGIPLRIYLGESIGDNISRGRLHGHPDGSWSLELDLTQTAARLMQVVDYWLSDNANPPAHLDAQRLSFVRAPRDLLLRHLISRMERGSVKGDHVPVMYALDISCLRLACGSLDELARACDSPRHFLLSALNMNARSVMAHEIAHLQECRANGPNSLHPTIKEALAYLYQAAYSDPADAFRAMMLHGFDITLMMPSFDAALRAMGPHAFCLQESYLRAWAKGMLDALMKQFSAGATGKAAIDASPILEAASSSPITESDIPFVERALCNPHLRVDKSLLIVRPAEPA